MSNWLALLLTLVIQAMVSMALLTLPVMAPVIAKYSANVGEPLVKEVQAELAKLRK